ncbi:MAG: urease subunit gamma [Nitrososphaera sp.]
MMLFRATVKGEPDSPPFTRTFDYSTADEEIFFSSADAVQEKLQRRMKINANEALVEFCAFVVKAVRAGMRDSDIQRDASRLLTLDSVMFGVPETLRKITFEARVDGKPIRKIELREPIPIGSYMLSG